MQAIKSGLHSYCYAGSPTDKETDKEGSEPILKRFPDGSRDTLSMQGCLLRICPGICSSPVFFFFQPTPFSSSL